MSDDANTKKGTELGDSPELSDEQLEDAAGGYEVAEAWPCKWVDADVVSMDTTTRVLQQTEGDKLLIEDGVPNIKRTL